MARSGQQWCDAFNKRFGDIAMPRKLMTSELVSLQYQVPWGLAYIRHEQEGWDL